MVAQTPADLAQIARHLIANNYVTGLETYEIRRDARHVMYSTYCGVPLAEIVLPRQGADYPATPEGARALIGDIHTYLDTREA